MSASTLNPQSVFPDLPRDITITKDGKLNDMMKLGLADLFQSLQKNFSNEGIRFPPLTDTQLASIESLYAPYIGLPLPIRLPDISGATVFDSTNRIPKQFIITYDTATPPNILAATWLILNVMRLHAGNPNGAVAGVLDWFCYDTVGQLLYVCTTSGSTVTAAWTQV